VQTQVQPVGAEALFARPNELNTRRACGGKSRAHASRDPQEGRHEAARAVRSATGGAEIVGTETAAARSSRETSLRRVCGKILSESKDGDGARLEGWLREHPARNPRKENTDTLLERPVRRKHRKRS
jgi:hypothetical protein